MGAGGGCPSCGLADLLRWRLVAAAGEAAQDAPLRHLQASRDRGDPRQHGGQARDVRLHVAQQLLQLVEHCNNIIELLKTDKLTPLLVTISQIERSVYKTDITMSCLENVPMQAFMTDYLITSMIDNRQ